MDFDKKSPPPVMVHQDGNRYLEPNGTDAGVYVQKNEKIILYCSDGFTFSEEKRLDAVCLGKNQYRIQQTKSILSIYKMKCNGLPQHDARRVGKCSNSKQNVIATEIHVGFQVPGLQFLPIMKICHNEALEHTYYTRYTLKPNNYLAQIDLDRPSFIKGIFYGGTKVQDLYAKKGQMQSFIQLLGEAVAKELMRVDDDVYLSRGHLMAKVDTIFGVLQRASFYFVNVFPQWQTINAGNWEVSEASLRAFVADEGIVVEVITGVFGILRYRDCNNILVDIYLNVGGRNVAVNPGCYKPTHSKPDTELIRKLPVPLFSYKLIINRQNGTGIVILSMNDPYADTAKFATEVRKICTNILDQIEWMDFKQTQKRGYMAACSVKEFVAKVPELPRDIGKGVNKLLLRQNKKTRSVKKFG